MDIFVIRESAVVSYLRDGYFDSQLPVLPPEVHVVRLTWMAKDDLVCKSTFLYWIYRYVQQNYSNPNCLWMYAKQINNTILVLLFGRIKQ